MLLLLITFSDINISSSLPVGEIHMVFFINARCSMHGFYTGHLTHV